MFEQFPYADLQQLNLDWIIKIAKDFLDQYTSIQQIINNGLTALDEKTAQGIADLDVKAEEIENLLNAWYTEHSEDIANALSNALLELSTELTNTIQAFNTAADEKAAQTIASIPSDYTTFFDNAFQYRGALAAGPYTNAKTGSYAVDNTVVTGLPTLNQRYAWLICIVPNQLYFLIDSSATRNVWYNEAGNGWRQLYPTFYGPLGAGPYTAARTGTYSVNNQDVTGLPYGMSQQYGWLTCIVPNSLYILVESNAEKTVWLQEANSSWVKLYNGYKGALGAGAYTTARTGVYTVDNQVVTGLPANMNQRYGWLICLAPNLLYFLVESNNEKTTWINEANTGWKLFAPEYKISGKKIAYTGDSLAESRFGGFDDNGGAYPELISVLTKGTYVNNAHSGATIANSSAQYIITTMVQSLPDDADIICLEGGINDYWLNVPLGTFNEADFTSTLSNTTFCGALENLFKTAINKWVGKPIIFIIPHKIKPTAWTANSAGYTFADMREKMLGICKKYSIPVVDLWADGGLNAYIDSLNNAYLNVGSNTHPDGCHPDTTGYAKYYVPRLISAFDSIMP